MTAIIFECSTEVFHQQGQPAQYLEPGLTGSIKNFNLSVSPFLELLNFGSLFVFVIMKILFTCSSSSWQENITFRIFMGYESCSLIYSYCTSHPQTFWHSLWDRQDFSFLAEGRRFLASIMWAERLSNSLQ